MTLRLRSPVTGALLEADGPERLRERDGRPWPCFDGIPFLRVGRDALVREVIRRQELGDREGALALLLADQDDWWDGPRPAEEDLRALVRDRDRLTLREAMAMLGFGRVGDYFAHRWSDPTFLAGLALLEAHWRPAASAFELACGLGHYGRELLRRGTAYTGADVVFSKLWLARHWVLPARARLVCFDAAAPWPLAEERVDLVFCHDAFYFLEPKRTILASLRTLAAPGGRVAVSHIHNSGASNLSAGHALSPAELARLFPTATVYDDAELTAALVEARAPRPAPVARLAEAEAFSVEDGAPHPPQAVVGGLALPPPEAALRPNPLYRIEGHEAVVAWPSRRYGEEYGGRATYPERLPRALLEAQDPGADALRRRILVDLPERW